MASADVDTSLRAGELEPVPTVVPSPELSPDPSSGLGHEPGEAVAVSSEPPAAPVKKKRASRAKKVSPSKRTSKKPESGDVAETVADDDSGTKATSVSKVARKKTTRRKASGTSAAKSTKTAKGVAKATKTTRTGSSSVTARQTAIEQAAEGSLEAWLSGEYGGVEHGPLALGPSTARLDCDYLADMLVGTRRSAPAWIAILGSSADAAGEFAQDLGATVRERAGDELTWVELSLAGRVGSTRESLIESLVTALQVRAPRGVDYRRSLGAMERSHGQSVLRKRNALRDAERALADAREARANVWSAPVDERNEREWTTALHGKVAHAFGDRQGAIDAAETIESAWRLLGIPRRDAVLSTVASGHATLSTVRALLAEIGEIAAGPGLTRRLDELGPLPPSWQAPAVAAVAVAVIMLAGQLAASGAVSGAGFGHWLIAGGVATAGLLVHLARWAFRRRRARQAHGLMGRCAGLAQEIERELVEARARDAEESELRAKARESARTAAEAAVVEAGKDVDRARAALVELEASSPRVDADGRMKAFHDLTVKHSALSRVVVALDDLELAEQPKDVLLAIESLSQLESVTCVLRAEPAVLRESVGAEWVESRVGLCYWPREYDAREVRERMFVADRAVFDSASRLGECSSPPTEARMATGDGDGSVEDVAACAAGSGPILAVGPALADEMPRWSASPSASERAFARELAPLLTRRRDCVERYWTNYSMLRAGIGDRLRRAFSGDERHPGSHREHQLLLALAVGRPREYADLLAALSDDGRPARDPKLSAALADVISRYAIESTRMVRAADSVARFGCAGLYAS